MKVAPDGNIGLQVVNFETEGFPIDAPHGRESVGSVKVIFIEKSFPKANIARLAFILCHQGRRSGFRFTARLIVSTSVL